MSFCNKFWCLVGLLGLLKTGYAQVPIMNPALHNKFEQIQVADSPHFTLLKFIPIEAKDIETDKLGNVFVVSKTNQLYKYSADGKLLSTLNYKYVGNISFVDPTNPLEIYVFYKELNKIIYLDNNLAYRGETDLIDLNIGQASAIARAFDNGIWAFDMTDLQLKKMDKNGENPQFSGNVKQYVSDDKTLTPNFIFDNNDRVYVNDSLNGVFVFDVFATYVRTIPLKGYSHIKVIGDDLYYYQDKQIIRYNLKTFQTFTFNLPDQGAILDVSIEKDRVYLLNDKGAFIYSY